MKKLLTIILISVCSIGCLPQKRASKAIKRIGAKTVCLVLVSEYPELFLNRTDTVWKDTIAYKDVLVYVPEQKTDTIYSDTSSVCKSFYFNDRKITFYIKNVNGKTLVDYTIKAFKTKVDSVPFEVKVPCPPCKPCPDISLLPKQGETDMQIIFKYWSWFSWLLLLIVIGFKAFKAYIKPI